MGKAAIDFYLIPVLVLVPLSAVCYAWCLNLLMVVWFSFSRDNLPPPVEGEDGWERYLLPEVFIALSTHFVLLLYPSSTSCFQMLNPSPVSHF